jgi:hypothetical protein
VSDEYIDKVCRVMLAANWHTYQILTKRADRMAELLQGKLREAAEASHIWWGVSVENRKDGLPRIDKLRSANPAVAFLSVEPLLEELGKLDLLGIHWVIVGGESGPRARRMEPSWYVVSSRSVEPTGSLSSSSNGVACAKPEQDENLMAEPTTSIPRLFQMPCLPLQVVPVYWKSWLLPDRNQ